MSDGQQWLREMVSRQHAGEACGIYAVCSAHEAVLEASFTRALADSSPLLVESTCNQVNQYGGYTGQTPAEFAQALAAMAGRHGFPRERLILGGDHLGPSPWQREPAAAAMARAMELVRDSVAAGYQKVHLDASMKLGDDPAGPLPARVAAERAADLAAAAEAAAGELGRPGPLYVIGTEVPIPGGNEAAGAELAVSEPDDVLATIDLTRQAFAARGLDEAWERVIAVVVQPGVEFGDRELHAYQPEQARPLSALIAGLDGLVYEAHSTDYQTRAALRALVEGHFAILKVGPALTFAYREAIFALSWLAAAWLGVEAASDVPAALEAAMLAQPAQWQRYYGGDAQAQQLARRYSFSDRARYYWPDPGVQAAVLRLLARLGDGPLPLTLLSQFAPEQYRRIRSGALANRSQAIIRDRIDAVLVDYALACGFSGHGGRRDPG